MSLGLIFLAPPISALSGPWEVPQGHDRALNPAQEIAAEHPGITQLGRWECRGVIELPGPQG